jgi:hypothetical protein
MNTNKHGPQDTELNYGLIWLRDRVAANSAFEEIDLTERKHYACQGEFYHPEKYHEENKLAARVSS